MLSLHSLTFAYTCLTHPIPFHIKIGKDKYHGLNPLENVSSKIFSKEYSSFTIFGQVLSNGYLYITSQECSNTFSPKMILAIMSKNTC